MGFDITGWGGEIDMFKGHRSGQFFIDAGNRVVIPLQLRVKSVMRKE